MITIRKSEARGSFDHGWLNSHHTFSFGDYYDPKHMGFRSLRVINEDRIAPKMGFPTHGHRDMEIITYVISGALEHKDSMGNGSVIRPNEIQYMSAGTGVRHSEFNHSESEPTHLLQMWIMPKRASVTPRYGQRSHRREEKTNNLLLLASGEDVSGAISIHQDAKLFASVLESEKSLEYTPDPRNGQWIQLISGKLNVNGVEMEQGDGAAIEQERQLKITASEDAEFVMFDLL